MTSAAATVAASTSVLATIGYIVIAAKMLRRAQYRRFVDYALGSIFATAVCYAVIVDQPAIFAIAGAGFLTASYDARRLDDAEERS